MAVDALKRIAGNQANQKSVTHAVISLGNIGSANKEFSEEIAGFLEKLPSVRERKHYYTSPEDLKYISDIVPKIRNAPTPDAPAPG